VKNWLSTVHLPGIENIEVDQASSCFKDDIQWAFANNIFQELCNMWGKPDWDLFASRPDPDAAHVDAFTLNWGDKFCYVFPPFCLLGRADTAYRVIVPPFWPTNPWFTQLANIVVDEPVIFPITDNELFLPFSSKTRPLRGQLRLIAARVSSKPSGITDF
jgi:hypothetical protein